jgi:hypothetical protein
LALIKRIWIDWARLIFYLLEEKAIKYCPTWKAINVATSLNNNKYAKDTYILFTNISNVPVEKLLKQTNFCVACQ